MVHQITILASNHEKNLLKLFLYQFTNNLEEKYIFIPNCMKVISLNQNNIKLAKRDKHLNQDNIQ